MRSSDRDPHTSRERHILRLAVYRGCVALSAIAWVVSTYFVIGDFHSIPARWCLDLMSFPDIFPPLIVQTRFQRIEGSCFPSTHTAHRRNVRQRSYRAAKCQAGCMKCSVRVKLTDYEYPNAHVSNSWQRKKSVDRLRRDTNQHPTSNIYCAQAPWPA